MTTATVRWEDLRREPFRLFFPLGVVLGCLGVGHWLGCILPRVMRPLAPGAFEQVHEEAKRRLLKTSAAAL